MVVSVLNPEVNYIELTKIYPEDLHKEMDLYEITLLEEHILVSIGNIQNTYIKKNISFFPLYLITEEELGLQIGVYEIKSTEIVDYIDENGNILFSNLPDPLIFSFVTKDFLKENRMIPKEPIKKKKQKEIKIEARGFTEKIKSIPENRKLLFDINPSFSYKRKELKEETKKEAKKIKRKYQSSSTDTWIQTYMKNKYYFSLNVDMNKDCFFHALKEAYQSIGEQTTIQKLRNVLSDRVTEEVYQMYSRLYSKYEKEVKKEKEDRERITVHYNKIQKQLKEGVLNREEKIKYIEQGKELLKENEILKDKKKLLRIVIDSLYFMKGVNDVLDFKRKVKSCDFWKEEWCLPLLEYLLNIKCILFDSQLYKENDHLNVLNCGYLIPEISNNIDGFQPEYYLMLEKIDKHYKIIGYKSKLLFTYKELPYDVKQIILHKCNEKAGQAFQYILSFQTSDLPLTSEKKSITLEQPVFDKEIVFSVYDNSTSKSYPGKGPNEKIPEELLMEFIPLSKENQWRKKLSNTWNHTFQLDGKNWASVEHFIQASKYKNNHRDFYELFSLDAGSELSKDYKKAICASKPSGIYKGEQLREESITIDPQWDDKKEQKIMYQAQMAKFSQNDELKRILLETKNALLVHQHKGKSPEVYNTLMLVREKLS